jgi:hypothetical protein
MPEAGLIGGIGELGSEAATIATPTSVLARARPVCATAAGSLFPSFTPRATARQGGGLPRTRRADSARGGQLVFQGLKVSRAAAIGE